MAKISPYKKKSRDRKIGSKKRSLLKLPNKIQFEIGPHDVDIDLKRELMIDPNSLDEELMGQAAKFAFVGVLEAAASFHASRLKEHADRRLNVVRDELRRSLAKEVTGRVTDSMVDAKARQDPEYMELIDQYQEAMYHHGVMENVRRAFSMRDWDLRELSLNARKEFMGSIDNLKEEAAEWLSEED